MRSVAELVLALEAAAGAEEDRDRRVRAAFLARTGHPRGIAPFGAEGTLWRDLEAADPPAHDAADALVGEAVTTYLSAGIEGRAALRTVFDRSRYLRWRAGWVAGAARSGIAEPGPMAIDACRRALAALALEAGTTDHRDTIVALDALYLAALRAGLDPAAAFQEAADAARSPDGEQTGASRLLANYLDPERVGALRRSAARRPSAPGGRWPELD